MDNREMSSPRRIYFDNAASAPLDERVHAAMLAALPHAHGNPSSLHFEGRSARRLLEDAREVVATCAGASRASEIVFTSSATEANDLAINGVFDRLADGRRRILSSTVEHPSVLAAVERLRNGGAKVDYLGLRPDGTWIVPESKALRSGDFLIAQWVNNETGVVQPIEELSTRVAIAEAAWHVDAVQAAPHLELRLASRPMTSAALSAHKMHGPKGIGALYLRHDTHLAPRILGGGQERERRAGTENVLAAVGFAKAFELAVEERDRRARRRAVLDARLLDALHRSIPCTVINSGEAPRITGIVSLRVPGLHGETALMRLDLEGIAVSLGSACSSGALEASHVLRAMGLSQVDNHSTLRVSMSAMNDENDVDRFVTALANMVSTAR